MKKTILAAGAVIAAALIFGSRDFGALPNKSDKKRYGKCSKYHMMAINIIGILAV